MLGNTVVRCTRASFARKLVKIVSEARVYDRVWEVNTANFGSFWYSNRHPVRTSDSIDYHSMREQLKLTIKGSEPTLISLVLHYFYTIPPKKDAETLKR